MTAIRFDSRQELANRAQMSRHSSVVPDRASTLSFWLLLAFLAILWVSGGASRADVLGQAFVRSSAWSIIVIAILALSRVDWRAIREPAIVLGAAALLLIFQSVPLPPAIWTEFPGRAIFNEAAILAGVDQPWRPLSISPSGTSNALASLVVPTAVLLLAGNLTREQHWRVAVFVLFLVGAGAVLGVLQFSGAKFGNPLINSVTGTVAGNFANRNHFALFLAVGCVLALAWAFRDKAGLWKTGTAFGLLVLFVLMTLATGSRSGVVVGLLGIMLALIAFREEIARKFRILHRRYSVALIILAIVAVIGVISLSIYLERAASVERATLLEGESDLRLQIWPIVLDMTRAYFPVGTGFGTFDSAYRIGEPDSQLNAHYVNLAHNDWLQVVLEGGVLGLVLFAASFLWFGLRSFNAWCVPDNRPGSRSLARTGSIVIVLILTASITDYPTRTPMVMALLALAAIWLMKGKSKGRISSIQESG